MHGSGGPIPCPIVPRSADASGKSDLGPRLDHVPRCRCAPGYLSVTRPGACCPECTPEKCCDPAKEPGVGGNKPCFEGHSCCPITGEWQCSIGDGKTFPCPGWPQAGGPACPRCPELDKTVANYDRFEGTGFSNDCKSDADCHVGGCSSEVCAAEEVITTCDALPWTPQGACGCLNGQCLWHEKCPQKCGGFAGLPCPGGMKCVDDPSDDCNPAAGGADCGGVCKSDPCALVRCAEPQCEHRLQRAVVPPGRCCKVCLGLVCRVALRWCEACLTGQGLCSRRGKRVVGWCLRG